VWYWVCRASSMWFLSDRIVLVIRVCCLHRFQYHRWVVYHSHTLSLLRFFLYLQFVSVRYNYRLFTDTLQIAVCGGHTDNWLSIGYILITSGLHLRSEVLSSSSVTSACGCVCQHRKSWIVWDIIVTILQEQDGQQLWRAS